MTSPSRYLIGIDAGGTQTRVVFRNSLTSEVSSFEFEGVNLKRKGLSASSKALANMILHACGDGNEAAELYVCAGIAGAGRPTDQQLLQEALEADLPVFKQSTIIIRTDADIAYYAAHKDQSGILIIVGTGSIILSRTEDGDEVRAGGWGYLLGDEAGGYNLGKAGLAAVADSFDQGPSTILTDLVSSKTGAQDANALITLAYNPQTKLQDFAPLIIKAAEQGDAVALQIIDHQLHALVNRLTWLLQSHNNISRRIAIFGGMSNSVFFSQRLQSQIKQAFPGVTFTVLRQSPAETALRLAEKLSNDQ